MEPREVLPAGDRAVAMDVGPAQGSQSAEPEDGERGSPGRMLSVVLVVLVVAAGGAYLFGDIGERHSNVRVKNAAADQWAAAPSAPDRPLGERWSFSLAADHRLAGVAIVGDTVVVASHGQGRARDELILEGLAARDGSMLWRQTIAGRESLIVLATGETTGFLSAVGADGEVDDSFACCYGSMAVLDPVSGTIPHSLELPEGAGVQVRPDGKMVVTGNDTVSLVDSLTGATLLEFLNVATQVDGEGWKRTASWMGDGWIVPTAEGWEVTGADGIPQLTLMGVEQEPVVSDDLVIHADGRTATAYHRIDGREAWRVEAPGDIVSVQSVDRPSVDTQGRFVVHVNELDSTGIALDPVPAPILLLDNGELVGPADSVTLDSLRRQRRALWWSWMQLEVDGRPLTACRAVRDGAPDGPDPCPADLALLDQTDEVVASADLDTLPDPDYFGAWRATDPGMLLVDTDRVRLHRWDDLSEAWSIDIDAVANPTVLASDRGILVATAEPDRHRVTWFD